MSEDKFKVYRVTSYLTASDYVTVFDSKKSRHLYRFNPDLSTSERETILDNLRFGADVAQFLGCGDLLKVKSK